MSKRIKILIGAALALALIGCIGLFYVYNKPHRNLANETAAYKMAAHDLYTEFATDEKKANEKYLGKAIEISGFVKEVSSGTSLIVYSEGTNEGGVQCEMDTEHKLTTDGLKAGQKITIKGQCNGILLEVGLTKALVIK